MRRLYEADPTRAAIAAIDRRSADLERQRANLAKHLVLSDDERAPPPPTENTAASAAAVTATKPGPRPAKLQSTAEATVFRVK